MASEPDTSQRIERLEAATAELVAITRALTSIVANLRAEADPDLYDRRLPDMERDLERLQSTLDEG